MEQPAAHIATAFQQFRAGNLVEAERACRGILAADPNQTQALHLLGVIASQSGRSGLAIECLKRAIEVEGGDERLFTTLGMAYAFHGELDQAIACHKRAIEIAPGNAATHSNLGNALKDQGRLSEATESYRQAILLRPGLMSAQYNLGVALQEQERHEEAIEHLRKALEIDPTHSHAHNAIGNSLRVLGIFDQAASHIERAVQLQPDLASAHFQLASILLLQGDFDRGWNEYEWRWKKGEIVERIFLQPQWDGSPLAGKTILIHAEQGLGDTFQFVRYAAVVKGLGATVIFHALKPTMQILKACPGIDRLVTDGDESPSFEFHAPLLSLPRILRTTLTSIPARIPYLFADSALISRWRSRLGAIEGFRIGVNWHGRSGVGEFRKRDIPLEELMSLTEIPRVTLISLQRDVDSAELARIGRCPNIYLPGDDFDTSHGAFMDTAAIMMNLDLVITSDTSIAHLAGALGVPVWLALPYAPDWRWMLERSDSPWYPTMRLFRQKSAGDWGGVFEEIGAALKNLV